MNNLESILLTLAGAVLTKQTSFRLGSVEVTASVGSGAPAHFTWASAGTAALAIYTGHTGTLQSGEITITISPLAPPPAALANVGTTIPAA